MFSLLFSDMPIRHFEIHVPSIAETAYIDPLALVIGKVWVGSYASLWPGAVARGDLNSISIGAYTNIQDGAVLHVTHAGPYCPAGRNLEIGERVTVGHQAVLHACHINHHCLVGIGAIVLDGVVLQPYTLLAAGSLVPPDKELEGAHLWRGNPAQKIRPLTEKEMAYFDYIANYYTELARRHKASLQSE